MSYQVSDIISRIQAVLNDSAGSIYTQSALLPFVQDAADDLQIEFELNGTLDVEKTTSSPITIPNVAATFAPGKVVSLTSLGLMPKDLHEPQKIQERLAGTTDLFVDMVRRQWEPNILITDSLRYWTFRTDDIFFIGATTDREIMIDYIRKLITIVDENTPIPISNSKRFFITRTAAYAAQFIGENETRATELMQISASHLQKMIGIATKAKQGTRTRRRPFIVTGRRRWT